MFRGVTYRGVRLLEHEEVLLNYDKKVSLHGAAITEGNRALESVEKEMRDLQLAVSEERRQIDLKKKEMAVWKNLEGEITTLQIEVRKARALEHTLNTNPRPKFGIFYIFPHQAGIDNVKTVCKQSTELTTTRLAHYVPFFASSFILGTTK